MKAPSRGRAAVLTSLAVFAATLAGVSPIGQPLTAFATTTTVTYGLDCTGTLNGSPVTVPFPVTMTGISINASAFPTNAAVSATGVVTVTVFGALTAGFLGVGFGITSGTLSGTAVVTASSASNTPPASDTASVTLPVSASTPWTGGRELTNLVTTLGSQIVTSTDGLFVAGVDDQPLTDPTFISGNALVPNGVPLGAVIGLVIDANTAVLSLPATASGTGKAGIARSTNITFGGAPPFLNVGSYVTAGVDGGLLGLTAKPAGSTFTLTAPIVGATVFSGCVADVILPVPNNLAVPFATTNLVAVNPTPNAASFNVGTSSLANAIAITATSNGPAAPAVLTQATFFKINTLPASGTLRHLGVPVVAGDIIAATAPNLLALTYDAGASPAAETFTYSVDDGVDLAAATAAFALAPPNTPPTAIVTLNVGTPPVVQPISQLINPSTLNLSCAAPAALLTLCPLITMPNITLNGTQQTTQAAINNIYVSDNRGDPLNTWSLSTYMVANGTFNSNAGCATAVNFCNQAGIGGNLVPNAALSQNHIPAANLTIGTVACVPTAGNANPGIDVGGGSVNGAGGNYGGVVALCNAAAPNAGGSFTVTGQFSLVIPSSTAAGTFIGVVEYLVV